MPALHLQNGVFRPRQADAVLFHAYGRRGFERRAENDGHAVCYPPQYAARVVCARSYIFPVHVKAVIVFRSPASGNGEAASEFNALRARYAEDDPRDTVLNAVKNWIA